MATQQLWQRGAAEEAPAEALEARGWQDTQTLELTMAAQQAVAAFLATEAASMMAGTVSAPMGQ